MIMTRSTLFTASQPSQLLSPYSPRPPPSPPISLLESLSVGRSSSLRSGKGTPSPTREYSSSPASPITPLEPEGEGDSIVTPAQSTIRSPTGCSSRQSSLKPRPVPFQIHPRRRSWFREDNPSAFVPPSPDPSALSPMATFHSSMSEDEQRDELWSEASSRSPASLYSLSPYPHSCKQDEEDREHKGRSESDSSEFRRFSIVTDSAFLAIPARTRSDSAPRRSNPALLVNGSEHDYHTEAIPRRASEGGTTSTSLSPSSAALSLRTPSQSNSSALASTFNQPRLLHSDRLHERSGSLALSSVTGRRSYAMLQRDTSQPGNANTTQSQPQSPQPRPTQLLHHPTIQDNDQQDVQPQVKKSAWERSPFQRSSSAAVEAV